MKTPSQLIRASLNNQQPVGWHPGLSLLNTNGTIDSSTAGYSYAIQTTTLIRAKTVDQVYYEIPFAQYIPVKIGEAAWLDDIRTNVVASVSGDFESGIISNATQNTKLSKVDVAVTPITQKIFTWAKAYEYTVPEIKKALALNNWDVIESRMKAIKTQWDLGIQQLSMLGLLSDSSYLFANYPGLLSNPNVTINLAVITKNISSFASAGGDFQTFAATVLEAYFANTNRTKMPDSFSIPMSDFLGLGAFVNPAFPVLTLKQALENVFKDMTGKANFKIYGNAYGDQTVNAGYWASAGTYRYALYNNNPDVLRMDIPVDFILGAPNSYNNWNWDAVGYGQATGVVMFRVPEVLYFDHT